MEKVHLFRLLSSHLLAATVALCAPAVLAQAAPPAASHPFAQSKPVPGQYIVVFKNSVGNPGAEAANIMRGLSGQVRHVYTSAIKGFAASLPDAAVQGLLNNPNVDYIEQDQTVALNQSIQNQATWGLDRIDQRDRPLDTNYNYNYTGAGVNAFIIDTGIRADHVELSGRLLNGYDAVGDGNGTNDCNGHGTHVAGTVGGTTWGVAKGASLIPVRVLNCSGSGSYAGVIAGIDWVAQQTALRPAAANMSLGGGKSTAVNAAVAGAVSAGVTMVVAAGNDNRNACNYSPSSEPSAITVGATTNTDARASYSNYGTCVDIFGPGSAITSAWNTSTTATNTINGTSMATPHVTGVAVLALAANPAASPAAVASFLVANASANKLTSIGTGSPNLLLYSMAADAPTEPTKQDVAVSSIVGKAVKIAGANWRAYATVTLRDLGSSSATVQNATVTGSFSPGGTASCITDNTSSCTLSSAKISATSTTLTVTNVSGTNLVYDASQNTITSSLPILKP
jgi:subtilisin family serine protease